MNNKKINILIFLIMMIEIIFLSSFVYAENFSKSGVYRVMNPTTGGGIICRGDGSVLLRTSNSSNEYIEILKDKKTGQNTYISKRIEAETINKEKMYSEDNEYMGDYEYPSVRMEIYNLDGTKTDFDKKNASYILYVVDNKIIYGKEKSEEEDGGVYIYDMDTGEEKKSEYPNTYCVEDKNIIIFSTYPGENNAEIKICDYNLNEIKTIKNYSFDTALCIYNKHKEKEKTFIKISKVNDNKDERDYNVLNDNFDLMFEENIKDNFYIKDDYTSELMFDNKMIIYDFENKKVIKEENNIEENNHKKLEDKYNTTGEYTGIMYGYYKIDNNKTCIYDNDFNLLFTIDKKYNWIYNYDKDEKVVYICDNGYWDEKNEKFVEDNEIYDKNGKLRFSSNKRIDVYQEDGLILFDNKFYDFDFNIVKDFSDEYVNDRFDRHELNGRVFYENRYNDDYYNNKKYNVYDVNFNLLYENVIYSTYYALDDRYSIVKDNKTIIYNVDGSIYKTIDGKYRVHHYTGDKYISAENIDTKRYALFDDNYNIVLSNYKMLSDLKDDYCAFQNGFKYGLIDYNGNIIISFSIFDTLNEDGYEEKEMCFY